MTWWRAWAAPLSLLLGVGCAVAGLVSMPPGSYTLFAAAGAFGLTFLVCAGARE